MAQLYKLISGILLPQYVVAILLKFKINKLTMNDYKMKRLQFVKKNLNYLNLKLLTRLKRERDNELGLSQR